MPSRSPWLHSLAHRVIGDDAPCDQVRRSAGSGPCPSSVVQPDRRLLVVEARLLRAGVPELARRCSAGRRRCRRSDSGSRGTSNTFMKIEIRVARPLRNVGSSTSDDADHLAVGRRDDHWAPRAPSRAGSRKKATTQIEIATHAAAAIHQPGVPARSAAITSARAMAQAPAMNQRPSGAVRIIRAARARGR